MKKIIFLISTLSLLAACNPKSTSSGSSGSTSTNTSSNSSPWNWTPTPTPTVTWTATPTPTSTVYSPCGDPIGDCSNSSWVIDVPVTRRGQNTAVNETNNIYNSWTSTEIGGFVTDGRLRLRIKANSQPPRSSCAVSGSYRHPAYTKLKLRLAVQLQGGGEIWAQTVGPIDVNGQSQIYDVPVANFPSAYPYIVKVNTVTTDTTCVWQTNANGSAYCSSSGGQAYCGCPVEAPDPTNCWSVNVQVVTSNTNNFR